jgi:DNA-binding transcriptional LysR family regulator
LGSIDDVLNGEVNVAFTRLLPEQTELEIEVIAEEPRVVALASTHPLAERKSLAFADLAHESFITNSAIRGEGSRPPRWLAEQRRHGLPGQVAAQSAGVAEILTLVAAGRGVCLVPSAVARHYPRGDVAYVPVEDADPAVVSLAWRDGGLIPPLAAFIESVRRVAKHRRQGVQARHFDRRGLPNGGQ